MRFRRYGNLILYLLGSLLVIGIALYVLVHPVCYVKQQDFSFANESFRAVHIEMDLKKLQENAISMGVPSGEYMTVLMQQNAFSLLDIPEKMSIRRFMRLRNQMVRIGKESFQTMSTFYEGMIQDIIYFPVPQSTKKTKWIHYENSWRNERTYGGKRTHEGTDIMAQENVSGKYPVVSMSDGVVTNLGWLELGGYRIGITSEHGLYFYYAHLDSYAEGIYEGMRVHAGQFLGYMGNTGYGAEGTQGKFPVHLHMGIYITDTEGKEYAVNPYWILKSYEKKVLYYPY